jgi:hypothetical protein
MLRNEARLVVDFRLSNPDLLGRRRLQIRQFALR